MHPLVPFAPFFKPPVNKAPKVVQVAFDKMTVIVLPTPNQWIEQVGNYINTACSGVQFKAAYFVHDALFALLRG